MNRIARISERNIFWISVIVCWLVTGTAAWGQATAEITGTGPRLRQNQLEAIRSLAARGDAEAQVEMGRIYLFGNGVRNSNIEAANWFRKAADQGDADGQFFLGVMCDSGYGIDEKEFEPQNQTEAANWFQKAAKGGSIAAQLKLGIIYAIGLGVEKDQAESVKWYYEAAVRGNAVAQIAVGLAYFSGSGVPQNHVLAYLWLYLSAQQMEGQIHPNVVDARRYLDTHLTQKQIAEAKRLVRRQKPEVEEARRQKKTEI